MSVLYKLLEENIPFFVPPKRIGSWIKLIHCAI